ncbi:MAG: hypothetical protein PHN88_03395 [Ignavibacteria bacterium]|nr:hypothetical protein [Ignavibacteria bacterium]
MKLFSKIIIVLFVLSFGMNLFAEGDPGKPYGTNDYKISLKMKNDYDKAKKEFAYRTTGKGLDFYIDFQLGVGSTSPNITSRPGNSYTEKAKLGYTVGGLLYLSVFDLFSFTTGLTFDGKSFGVQKPALTQGFGTLDSSASTNYVAANYINIPLFIDLGGMVSKDVGLWFTGGPYLGFLISKPDNTYKNLGYKSFDLGLSGTLTANYVVMYPFSIIFGTTFKYGGLNNLMSTDKIEKITTTNFTFFSGVRFGL